MGVDHRNEEAGVGKHGGRSSIYSGVFFYETYLFWGTENGYMTDINGSLYQVMTRFRVIPVY